jgi:hypothetical protein
MSLAKPFAILVLLLMIGLLGGALYLGFADFPAPTTRQERVIPNDRFPR